MPNGRQQRIVLTMAHARKLSGFTASGWGAEAAGESDAERGRQNYYQCFVDEDWASNPEYIFAIGAQTPSNNAMQMIAPPRQWNPEEGDGYTADGFREYMNPTLQIVEAFLTDKGLPL